MTIRSKQWYTNISRLPNSFVNVSIGRLPCSRLTTRSSDRRPVVSKFQIFLASLSPDGKWVVVTGATEKADGSVVVYPVSGGSPTLICRACEQAPQFERGPVRPYLNWSIDGKF